MSVPQKNPHESYQIMLNVGFDPLQCTSMKKNYMIAEKKTQWTSSFVADCSNQHPNKHPNKHPPKMSCIVNILQTKRQLVLNGQPPPALALTPLKGWVASRT